MFFELFVAFIWLIAVYFWYRLQFWKRKNIPNIRPSFWCAVESLFGIHKMSLFEYYASVYEQFSDVDYGGCFKNLKPQLVVRDPALIRRILGADFEYFENRGSTTFDIYDRFTQSLFSMPGNALWKHIRKNLLPIFSATEIKASFEIIEKQAELFVKKLKENITSDNAVFDIEDMAVNYAIDTISSILFNIEANCASEPDSRFKHIASIMFLNDYKQWIRKQIDNFAPFLPRYFPIFRVNIVSGEVRTFFRHLIRDLRRNTDSKSVFVKRLMSLQVDDQTEEIDSDLIAAQCFIFFAAGFRPVSFILSMAILELAANHTIQSKLRYEINAILGDHENDISYEMISNSKLPFLDKVVKETLRKYPTVPILSRICTQPYRVPDGKLTIEKGVEIIIPVAGIHFDEKYFAKCREFDPERTFPINNELINSYSYLPFGKGPRQCIANTFSKIAIKTALVHLCRMFTFETINETIYPVKFEKNKLFTRSAHRVVIKCSLQ